jgi:hypothetical protein
MYMLALIFSRNHVIAREKKREQLGGGAIADSETRAKNGVQQITTKSQTQKVQQITTGSPSS